MLHIWSGSTAGVHFTLSFVIATAICGTFLALSSIASFLRRHLLRLYPDFYYYHLLFQPGRPQGKEKQSKQWTHALRDWAARHGACTVGGKQSSDTPQKAASGLFCIRIWITTPLTRLGAAGGEASAHGIHPYLLSLSSHLGGGGCLFDATIWISAMPCHAMLCHACTTSIIIIDERWSITQSLAVSRRPHGDRRRPDISLSTIWATRHRVLDVTGGEGVHVSGQEGLLAPAGYIMAASSGA
ncbi:hypothetical protein GGR56DRAFT_590047 [Xylariaceae sp. FL0804]|nr:hypothetical protein GGR56DRAFT_590047 [Xylariaceae sp. FL0804]